jgi:hypothetical protein
VNARLGQPSRSLNNFGYLLAVAYGNRIGASEMAKIAVVTTIRTDVDKSVQEHPVTKIPEPQFPGGSKHGVNLALLRKAQQEHNFSSIKNLFLMCLLQGLRQFPMRIIHRENHRARSSS